MYRNLTKDLCTKNYLQGVDVINFILSNMKNISRGKIRCPYMKCKNKKFHHNDVVMMHLLKIVCRKILVMVCTQRTLCSLQEHVR